MRERRNAEANRQKERKADKRTPIDIRREIHNIDNTDNYTTETSIKI